MEKYRTEVYLEDGSKVKGLVVVIPHTYCQLNRADILEDMKREGWKLRQNIITTSTSRKFTFIK